MTGYKIHSDFRNHRTKFNLSAVLDGGESGMKVTYHTYQMSRSISVNCHGSCPLLCGCHGYLACCRSPWWQAGCLPIGWEQLWARRITVRSLAKAPGGRRNTCAQRSLLDFGRWPQKVGSSKRRRKRAEREEEKKRSRMWFLTSFPIQAQGLKWQLTCWGGWTSAMPRHSWSLCVIGVRPELNLRFSQNENVNNR